MKDADCKNCYDCGKAFHTFRRRHHCRVCGQIFCWKCCVEVISGALLGHEGDLRCWSVMLASRSARCAIGFCMEVQPIRTNLWSVGTVVRLKSQGDSLLGKHGPRDVPIATDSDARDPWVCAVHPLNWCCFCSVSRCATRVVTTAPRYYGIRRWAGPRPSKLQPTAKWVAGCIFQRAHV